MAKKEKEKIKKCKYNDCNHYYYNAKRFCSKECKAMFQFFSKLNLIFSALLAACSFKRDYLKVAIVQDEYLVASSFTKNMLYQLRQNDFIDMVWISHVSFGEEKSSSGPDPWIQPKSNGKKEWEHLFSLLSKDDIKALKVTLSKRYHPDINKGKEEIMKQLNDLFDRLLA